MKWVFVAALAGACSKAEPAPSDVYVAPTDVMLVHGCVLLSLSTDANGDCYARWTCEVGGVRALLCGRSDAGTGCSCLLEGSAAVTIATTPSSCADAATVTAFASAQCGWEGL
ncbi:MAG: hypothetical protein JO257_03665 [Deltaproteobacteria bacterium]|nr:hypothetical protein [Deltaproteobacteria bacterium]